MECERVFSEVNNTKTENRNLLSIYTLNNLITIASHDLDFENFNYMKSIELWKDGKKRYFV